jgi:hypothetical protein
MRYRSAALAEFMRSLRTLEALQAEQAHVLEPRTGVDLALELPVTQLAAPAPVRAQPSRPATRLARGEPADRTNPSPSWHTCSPNRPWPTLPCTSRRHLQYQTNPSLGRDRGAKPGGLPAGRLRGCRTNPSPVGTSRKPGIDPLRDRFHLSGDPAVNYMLFTTRG